MVEHKQHVYYFKCKNICDEKATLLNANYDIKFFFSQ